MPFSLPISNYTRFSRNWCLFFFFHSTNKKLFLLSSSSIQSVPKQWQKKQTKMKIKIFKQTFFFLLIHFFHWIVLIWFSTNIYLSNNMISRGVVHKWQSQKTWLFMPLLPPPSHKTFIQISFPCMSLSHKNLH